MTKGRVYRAPRPGRSGVSVYNFNEQGEHGSTSRGPVLPVDERSSSQIKREQNRSLDRTPYGNKIADFLCLLSPGIEVVVQYDCQPASYGCFQGLKDGYVLLTNYNGYPGLVRLDVERINAISVF